MDTHLCLDQDSVNFCERPDSKYFKLVGHMTYVSTSQFCWFSGKAATDNM